MRFLQKEIFDGVNLEYSYATIKRILTNLISDNYLTSTEKGRGAKYKMSPICESAALIFNSINHDVMKKWK